MAFGLPATAKLSIPKEGLSLETSETAIGSCTATSESAYTGPGDTWENGVDLPAGSGFTNSESELKDSIPAHYTGTVTCQSLRAITLEANEHEVGTPLVWHDTTHETSTILNGS